jgi:hypothetical protein
MTQILNLTVILNEQIISPSMLIFTGLNITDLRGLQNMHKNLEIYMSHVKRVTKYITR